MFGNYRAKVGKSNVLIPQFITNSVIWNVMIAPYFATHYSTTTPSCEKYLR